MIQAKHHHEAMREPDVVQQEPIKQTSDYTRWNGVPLNNTNFYERGFSFDLKEQRFK
jgi:hypothetical protein